MFLRESAVFTHSIDGTMELRVDSSGRGEQRGITTRLHAELLVSPMPDWRRELHRQGKGEHVPEPAEPGRGWADVPFPLTHYVETTFL